MVFSTTVYLVVAGYFALLMAIELGATLRKHERFVFSDSLNSLLMGVGSVVVKTLFVGLELFLYAGLYDAWHLLELDPADPLVWIVAYVLADFCFYWFHRFGHTVNVLWASHVQHHSSEEYNLTTALRQEWTSAPYEVLYYLPLALLGIPYDVFAAVLGLNLLYQFWLHSRHIPKLPRWIEFVFNTASHHRVHHGQNPIYMDRNYGGTLIVWDRLFGTFQEELEEEPVVYGVTTPPHSWNPFVTVGHVFALLWKDVRAADRWSDKLTIWFRPTGWRPRNLPAWEKQEGYAPRFAAAAPPPFRRGALVTFLLAVAGFGVYLSVAGGTLAEKLPLAATILALIGLTGWLLDRPAEAPALSAARESGNA